MDVITRRQEPIFAFNKASRPGLNLFAGKTVDVLDPQQPRNLHATAQRRASVFWQDFLGESKSRRFFGEIEQTTKFTEWYSENAEKIANDIVKKIGTEGSNFDLKSSILKSKKFYELTKEIYLGPYLATTRLHEKDLQIIFQDILFSEEIIQIASFEDLVHGLMIAENDLQIKSLQSALRTINRTYEEYLKLAGIYYDKKMYVYAFTYFNSLVKGAYQNDIYVLSTLSNLHYSGLGCQIDRSKAIELSEHALVIEPYNSILVNNLNILYTEVGKKGIAALYNHYAGLLVDKTNFRERTVLYQDLKKAIAASTIKIGITTPKELQSAIEAYEKRIMGLPKDIRIIVFLKFRLMELENPNKTQFVKNLQRLLNIGVEFSRINLLLMHPKGEKIADKFANGLIQSELYDHHIISTITHVDSSFTQSIDKRRFADLLLSLCSPQRISVENCQLILNLIYLDLTNEMVLTFFKLGNIGWKYTQLYSKTPQSKRNHLQTVLFPYLKKRLVQLESKSSEPFLNITRILKDPEASKWKIKIRSNNVSDTEWLALYGTLELKMTLLFDPIKDKEILLNALTWFDKIPATRDAKADLQLMRKRVSNIIDYINQPDVDVEIAKKIVKKLSKGGRSCPDGAAVALEKAERYVTAFSKKDGEYEKYVINITVNEFKRNIIASKFVNPNDTESIETYLYHLNQLNIPLGLESLMKGMLYSMVATKTPLKKAIEVSYSVFNLEDFIGFIQSHIFMEKLFITDPQALERFKQLIWDAENGIQFFPTEDIDKYISRVNKFISLASSIEWTKELKTIIDCFYYTDKDELFAIDHKKAMLLDNLIEVKLVKLSNDFKREKTIMLLKDAGFLTDSPNYEYPEDIYWKS